MAISKRVLIVAAAFFAIAGSASAADMIGNCELSGAKGSIPIAAPAKAGQLTVQVSLPAPIWWNGDTPEAIKDGMEYCMAAEIAWRAGYDKLEVVNVGWDALIAGQTDGFDLLPDENIHPVQLLLKCRFGFKIPGHVPLLLIAQPVSWPHGPISCLAPIIAATPHCA